MRGPKPESIELTSTQRSILKHICRGEKNPQQLVRRSHIILEADQGASNEQIAQSLGVNRNTVRTWRARWAAAAEKLAACEAEENQKAYRSQIVEKLSDELRGGTPATFSAEQICQIVALACQEPVKSERPITHWTSRELADEAIKRGIVSSISPRHLGRFLKSVRP